MVGDVRIALSHLQLRGLRRKNGDLAGQNDNMTRYTQTWDTISTRTWDDIVLENEMEVVNQILSNISIQ